MESERLAGSTARETVVEHGMREVVRASGVTSRTLRHYEQVGLLLPSSTGAGGERRYDAAGLLRLQRILVMRGLGLPLPRIAEVLDARSSEADALRSHVAALESEREKMERRINAVRASIAALETGRTLTMKQMFDGFDHTQHSEEVAQRWGKQAAVEADAWWNSLSAQERGDFKGLAGELAAAWTQAAEDGLDPSGAQARSLAARHLKWLAGVPGTPSARGEGVREYVLGLADMYVADPRFGANYGGESGARFVRAALRAHLGERP